MRKWTIVHFQVTQDLTGALGYIGALVDIQVLQAVKFGAIFSQLGSRFIGAHNALKTLKVWIHGVKVIS